MVKKWDEESLNELKLRVDELGGEIAEYYNNKKSLLGCRRVVEKADSILSERETLCSIDLFMRNFGLNMGRLDTYHIYHSLATTFICVIEDTL